jgi:hypothetical protein
MTSLKKILLIVVVMALVICLSAGAASAKSDNGKGLGQGQGQGLELQKSETQDFTDVEGHWAKWVIKKAQARGIFEGFEDNTFRPEEPLTKAQAFVLLDKMTADDEDDDGDVDEDDDADDEDDDGDVDEDDDDDADDNDDDGDIDEDDDADDEDDDVPGWAKNSVHKAVYNGYIKRFNSDKQCERAYFMIMVAQVMEDEGNEDGDIPVLPELPEGYENPFQDLDDYENLFTGEDYEALDMEPSEMYEYLLRLHEAGIIKGSDGNLNPKGSLKRAEMAVLIDAVTPYFDED